MYWGMPRRYRAELLYEGEGEPTAQYGKSPNRCGRLCRQYAFKRVVGKKVYRRGVKYCQHCAIFMEWSAGWRCPCCNTRMRGEA